MEKIPKACEPCRRRKIRCDGQTPCNRCDKKPEECTYRLRTRVRRSVMQRVAAAAAQTAASGSDVSRALAPRNPEVSPVRFTKRRADSPRIKPDPAYSNVYQGVAAVPQQDPGRDGPENSRLFYGPASQFAFLQQVHRSMASCALPVQADKDVQEGGAGLDLFLQRSFFFGTASRIDTSNLLRPASALFPHIPIERARVFLDNFRAWSLLIYFFTSVELDQMLDSVYGGDAHAHRTPSQTRAVALAVLANGALATSDTDIAEMLFTRAKYEAIPFDDTVSLQMIQFPMLVADYQTGMGRSNLVYLALGTACRKAFAMGLHREAANFLTRAEHQQKHRATLWALYTLETWYSMTVGRETSLKMADISTPFPDDNDHLVSASQLAHLLEKLRTTIYTKRYDSLRKLYQAAESIHTQLREFAEKHGIGGAQEADSIAVKSTSLMLYNMYYHSVLLIYRPFLVADFALSSTPGGQSMRGTGVDAMWLRQACRQAIDSAQDQILHAHTQIRKHELCRASRYNGFFFESSCAVLFFDIVRHPSKYTYNVEYINMALSALDSMIDDEPLTNARNSIRQILRVVEDTISRKGPAGMNEDPDVSAVTDPLLSRDPAQPSPPPLSGPEQQSGANRDEPIPWLDAPEKPLIYFPDLGGGIAEGERLPVLGQSIYEDTGVADGDALDPLLRFHYDVMATDLYSFFPLNMSPPCATGTGGGVHEGEGTQAS